MTCHRDIAISIQNYTLLNSFSDPVFLDGKQKANQTLYISSMGWISPTNQLNHILCLDDGATDGKLLAKECKASIFNLIWI